MWRTLVVIFATSLVIGITCHNKNEYRDYEYNPKTNAFYKLHIVPKNNQQAIETCKLEGASLMVPTDDDIKQLHGMLKKYPDIQDFPYVGNDGLTHESDEETPIIDLSEESDEWRNPGLNCEVVTRNGEIESTSCYRARPFICKVEADKTPYDERCGVYSNGYTYYDSVKSCYYVPPLPLTWNEAYSECEKEGAHLIVLKSAAESLVVKNFLRTAPRHSEATTSYFFFAGIRANRPTDGSQRVFRTIFNETLEEAGFSQWSDGEPNNHQDREYCGTVFSNNGLYNDADCIEKYNFICQKRVAS